jgi:glutathione S-transferase
MRVSDIELYHYPATRSARVKWLLHKLVGDEFKVNRIDLYSLEAHGPDYLRLNPNHNVPLIRFRMGCRRGGKRRHPHALGGCS